MDMYTAMGNRFLQSNAKHSERAMPDTRETHRNVLKSLSSDSDAEARNQLSDAVAPDSPWHVAHPVNDLTGPQQFMESWLRPLRRAIPGAMRRDDIVMGGAAPLGSAVRCRRPKPSVPAPACLALSIGCAGASSKMRVSAGC